MKDTFSSKKIIENRILNYAGIQIFRVLLSSIHYYSRSILQPRPKTKSTSDLQKFGYTVIPHFLSQKEFQKVKKEYFTDINSGSYNPFIDGGTRVERYTFSSCQWKMLPAIKKLFSLIILLK